MPTNIMRNRVQNYNADKPKMLRSRSVFPAEFKRKQTMKAGYIYPFLFEEVEPGDTWQMYLTYVMQMLPQVTAVKDNLVVSTFLFYDAARLLWENFGKMLGAKEHPNDHNDYIAPCITPPEGGWDFSDLSRYLEKPAKVVAKSTCFAERMYNHIYNEYFRSSILMDEVPFNTSDADDDPDDYKLLKITKPHDYFTDCLPDIQQGEPLTIPIGTSAPVFGDGNELRFTTKTNLNSMMIETPGVPLEDNAAYIVLGNNSSDITTPATGMRNNKGISMSGSSTSGVANGGRMGVITKNIAEQLGTTTGLTVDLTQAIGADLSALRTLIATQTILEADNRSGIRYTEIMQSRYGCINPDLQIYRPQYLGGSRNYLFTTPVIQSSATGSGSTVQGNMSGLGACSERLKPIINASFGEFGYIMGLVVVSAIPQYQYGMPKKHRRYERFDYFHPEFQLISDEPVYNYELYCQDDTIVGADGKPVNDKVWGYNRRYESLRMSHNDICGQLMAEHPQSLSTWTYAEKMDNLQNLNEEFLLDKSDVIVQNTMAVQFNEENEVEEQFIWDSTVSGVITRSLIANPIPQTGGRLV